MKKGKNRAAAAVELVAVLLATAAAFAWGQRAALIERGVSPPPDPGYLLHRKADRRGLDRGAPRR